MFNYIGQVVTFVVEVSEIKYDTIITDVPEFFYKNLDRAFSRVSTPPDLKVLFTFHGERYSLDYPKIRDYENDDIGDLIDKFDTKNLQGLNNQIGAWIKDHASDYKIVFFQKIKPSTTEEHIVAETGKTLFLPSTTGTLPLNDLHPKKRFVTVEIFQRYLESTGVNPKYMDDAIKRFIKQKNDAGILSDAWVPILFQEYVLGYIHIWTDTNEKPSFTYDLIETMYQFTKVLAFSLKINGYFKAGLLKNNSFSGEIVDISPSGVLFAYPHSPFSSGLLLDSELSVLITVPQRSLEVEAKIIRTYKDHRTGYFGCRFLDMATQDTHFLFEYLYGKPFTDADTVFVAGQV
jgi:hypothetical protein